MTDKNQILRMLEAEFKRWEDLLASLSDTQLIGPHLADNWSIKDVIGHLRAWQQVSIARLEAAQSDQEPIFPAWLAGLDPESEADKEHFNARIYETYREQTWPEVYQVWRSGFLRFLKLGEAIPDHELMDTENYPWLKGYALFAVLQGSYGHHAEHLEMVRAWVRQNETQECQSDDH